jgi:CheY-like chemotaxis protein
VIQARATVKRILVVDDNEDVANSIAEVLRLMGHEARVAYNGRAALDSAAQAAPEVMLLDIVMPGMSGLEVARQIRLRHGPALLLIALTAFGQDADRQMSREAGFDQHLVKPVDMEYLKRLLEG